MTKAGQYISKSVTGKDATGELQELFTCDGSTVVIRRLILLTQTIGRIGTHAIARQLGVIVATRCSLLLLHCEEGFEVGHGNAFAVWIVQEDPFIDMANVLPEVV